jgi:hypothetical protein
MFKNASLSSLKENGFKGVDASLEISLREYGIIWKETEKETIFVYQRDNYDEGKHSFSFHTAFFSYTDVEKEFNWVEWKKVLAFLGMTMEEFKDAERGQQVFDLELYYGLENVFGTDYGSGIEISFS